MRANSTTMESNRLGPRFKFRKRLYLGLATVLTLLVRVSVAQRKDVTLHVFTGGTDGGNPTAALAADQNGNLFGTTWDGGSLGNGVIFEEIAPATSTGSWTYSVLYNFTGKNDGCCQYSAPALDGAGRLYGVTNNGLPGGSIFQLTPAGSGTWDFALVANFQDPTTYATETPLSFDKAGRIYAASYYGGLSGCNYSGGCGNIVQLTPPATQGGTWTQKTLYQFTGGSDGGNPSSPLISGPKGVFYGSAAVGGLVTASCPLGCGLIYQLTPPTVSGGNWTETVLYAFQGTPDGADPYYLTGDTKGALYGVGCCHGSGSAVHIFKLLPPGQGQSAWTKTVIHGFSNLTWGPSYITVGSNGAVYGAAFGEIDLFVGYVFQLAPPATQGGLWTFTNLGNPGPSRNPNGVTPGLFGALYGTLNGGDSDFGAIFDLTP